MFDALQNIVITDLKETKGGNNKLAYIFESVGLLEQIKKQNLLVNERANMLTRIFSSWNYRSCILKGQGVAQLYSNPLLRQSGDIDIWVEGNQDNNKMSKGELYRC